MARPAIVIGLGGTGQWVLTFLKKDLEEQNNGKVPDNVRLLSFDTVSEAEAQQAVVAQQFSGRQAAYEKEAKRIGSVQLEPDVELVHIGGDCWDLGNEIAAGMHPHLNWFDVDYWKKGAGLRRDNWILDRGAGRFRQFGLLAVYKDLLGGRVRSEILKRLPNAINEIQEHVQEEASFEVILVSSIAGGTGSAMLIPFGVLVQKMCENYLAKIRTIVVLPSAFSPGKPSVELELRGGAALRELSRAMIVPGDYKASMTLVPGDREYENVQYNRPFDGIYFIDGMKDGKPINEDPKFSVFPAASAWVRQILDPQSGTWFTNYVTTNLAGATSDPKRRAEGVFGVFGVRSLYTPERTLKQTYQLKLADQTLRHLTDAKPLGSGNRLVSNPTPSGLPAPNITALNWMKADEAGYGEEKQMLTSLLQEMASTVELGGENNPNLVNKRASAGVKGRTPRERTMDSWGGALTTLPRSAEFDGLRDDVKNESLANFYQAFQPSDTTSPPRDPGGSSTYTLFTTGIETFVTEHHGGLGANDDYGSLGVVAENCSDAQVQIFERMLRLDLLDLLNSSPGRLGYAIRVVDALGSAIGDFQSYLKKVETQRGTLATRSSIDDRIEKSKARWMKKRGTKPSLAERVLRKQSEEALKAERSYLQARADQVDYIREVTFHIAVSDAANRMKKIADATAAELRRWEYSLLDGDKALQIRGLLEEFDRDLNRITTTIRSDKRSAEIEDLVQVERRESEINQSDIDWALQGISWQAANNGDSVSISLDVAPEGQYTGTLDIADGKAKDLDRRKAELNNKSVLEEVLGQRFGTVDSVAEMLQWCENDPHYSDAKNLATDLADATVPLTNVKTGTQPVMESFSISLNKEDDPNGYAIQLEEQARMKVTGTTQPNNDHPVAVLDSEDPYRLTAVRTWVGLMLEEFKTWDTSYDAYQTELNKLEDNQTDHDILVQQLQSQYTQQAEKEAVALEAMWRAQRLGRRVLNPRMVSLIGKPRDLQTALQCWALGWAKPVSDEHFADRSHWQLAVPGWDDYEYWMTPNRDPNKLEDPFSAIESFVLVGHNYARGREGTTLDKISLLEQLREQRELPDPPDQEGGEDDATLTLVSPLQAAIEAALEKGGLVDQWGKMAGSYIDESDSESYRNPVYRDLADYSRRYFQGVLKSME